MDEVWRDIKGYEGIYMISNYGKVKSVIGWNGHEYIHKEKILKPRYNKLGYEVVDLVSKKIKHRKRVHRLLAEAFIPNPNKYPYINHIDCDPSNNSLENLEWCTQKQNIQHAKMLGRLHHRITNPQELAKKYNEGLSTIKLAKIYGVTPSCIRTNLLNQGIKLRDMKQERANKDFDSSLFKSLVDSGMRTTDLATRFNLGAPTICYYKNRYKQGLL